MFRSCLSALRPNVWSLSLYGFIVYVSLLLGLLLAAQIAAACKVNTRVHLFFLIIIFYFFINLVFVVRLMPEKFSVTTDKEHTRTHTHFFLRVQNWWLTHVRSEVAFSTCETLESVIFNTCSANWTIKSNFSVLSAMLTWGLMIRQVEKKSSTSIWG